MHTVIFHKSKIQQLIEYSAKRRQQTTLKVGELRLGPVLCLRCLSEEISFFLYSNLYGKNGFECLLKKLRIFK